MLPAEVSENKSSAENSGTRYAIGYTTDNTPVAIIKDNILEGVPKAKWVTIVKSVLSEKFGNGIPISGRLIRVNKITRNEFTKSKYSQYLKNADEDIYSDKFKTANNLDDVIISTTNYINEDLNHDRNDNITEFARGDVLIRVGKNDYIAKVIVGFTAKQNMLLYDIVDFEKTSFKIKERTPRTEMPTKQSIRNEVSSTHSIPTPDENVKQKQFEIIQSSNPFDETLGDHTWIKSVDDIKTYQEAIAEDNATTPDFTQADLQKALDTGRVTVYSSYPIKNGTFVTPSKMEAQNYAGEGKVYSKTAELKDVAWIDSLQGQYAKVDTANTTQTSKGYVDILQAVADGDMTVEEANQQIQAGKKQFKEKQAAKEESKSVNVAN